MTVARIRQVCGVPERTAVTVLGLIRGTADWRRHPAVVAWARECYHDPRRDPRARPECKLLALNAELHGHGLEAIRGRYVDRYHGTIQATYVNTGDPHAGTILFDSTRRVFTCTTVEDWITTYHYRVE